MLSIFGWAVSIIVISIIIAAILFSYGNSYGNSQDESKKSQAKSLNTAAIVFLVIAGLTFAALMIIPSEKYLN